MTTLQIYLPAYSEDKDAQNRDGRDIVEENISQASVLYNLLASIVQKENFKITHYGQNHIGFEIVAKHNNVYFYAVAPLDLIPVVQQAITSAYKGAKIEVIEEYNLFTPESELANIRGGKLSLREHFAYPIANYTQTKQDIMKAILGAVINLKETDAAGIQFLIRPAYSKWTKDALAVSKNVGKKKGSLAKDIAVSFIKPADENKDSSAPQLSGLDRNLIEAIEDKVKQPGFETAIRVLVSTNSQLESNSLYQTILASFRLLDSPKSNGFKIVEANNISKFIQDYSLRLFHQSENKNILNVTELATIFHLPDQSNIPTSQVDRQLSKQVDGPRDFPEDGLLLGHNVFRGNKRKVILSEADRMRHVYIVGQTGTGKSVLLENIVVQDMQSKKGFGFCRSSRRDG